MHSQYMYNINFNKHEILHVCSNLRDFIFYIYLGQAAIWLQSGEHH